MSLLQIDLLFLLFAATGIISILPSVIETARKQGRETHVADLRSVTGMSDVSNVIDLIEGHFWHQSVVFLKMSQAILLGLWLCGFGLLVSGYILTSAVVEDIRKVSDHLPQGCSSIKILDGIYLRVPDVHFGLSTIIGALVLVSLAIIAVVNQFPRYMKDIINPPRYGS